MTKEGRLTRGKANYEAKRFLNNPETLEYLKSIEKPEEESVPETKEEESKSKKRK